MLTAADLREACANRRLLYTVARGSSFWGLHDLFRENAVVCTDDSPEFDGTGVRFVSHEAIAGIRVNWTTKGAALLDDAWQRMDEHVDGQWTVIAPRACPAAAAWCQRTSSTLCQAPAPRCDLADKRALLEILTELGLPRLPGQWIAPETACFRELAASFGVPFVVQTSQGQTGSGTAFVRTEPDWTLAAAMFRGEPVWVAPFAGQLSLNVNAIALPGASRAGYPSVQLTGLEFANANEGMYCGNDYSAATVLPGPLLEDVRQQTETVGDAIADLGYRGLFGLDFVVNDRDGRAVAVDLNPRVQGSTPLHTQAERRASRTPLAAVGLLVEAGLLDVREAEQAGDYFGPLRGSQVRYRFGQSTGRLDNPPRPGVYSQDGIWKRPGWLLEELQDGEVLLTGGPPRPGALVEQGAQLFRIYAQVGMIDPVSRRPLPWVARLVSAVFPSGAVPGSDRRR